MSIPKKRFSRTLLILAEVFIFVSVCLSQKIEVSIKIEIASSTTAHIKGKILTENAYRSSKNWAFLHSIAGVENLGERISEFTLSDKNNLPIPVKKLIPGEYLAESAGEAVNFSYRVDLTTLKNRSSMAHASWLTSEQGFLMLDDLLPQFTASGSQPFSARIHFQLPNDWKIAGNETLLEKKSFDVANIEKAVFFIGKDWREIEIASAKNKLNLTISGEWQFSDAEAAKTASEILNEYSEIFGEISNQKQQIFLVKFPKEIKAGNWEAETRGSSVVILSSDMPFKTQSIQRLHEQLRHELFHLWMPNNLALSGNYDWFYEGFALYQSLRTGVDLNRIRFEDFLDTLGRAFDLDSMQSQKLSLIEASKNRWNGANSQVYARGMLVAFLADAALLRESKGKRSIAEVLREIYQKHKKPNQPNEDGNGAIIKIFEAREELRPIVERYIKKAEDIKWQADLESVGVETGSENFPVKLVVKSKLNNRQKDLLNKLGYNNWRKASEKSK